MAAVPASINPFGSSSPQASNAVAAAGQQRELAEVQGAIAIAKRFPRDERAAMDRILNACSRPGLAEAATYTYARGGSDVTGPSIRLAEAIAQTWGNLAFGIRELEQRDGESTVEAFAWDMEHNTRQVKVFQVPHERHTKRGVTKLTDPRDVYELVANQGARRLRACILGVIPGDVIDAAVTQCEVTLKTRVEVTPERVAKMLETFKSFGVTKAHVEARIQRKLDAITPVQFLQLGKIANSLRDGMSKPDEWFAIDPATPSAVSALNERIAKTDAVVQAATPAKPPVPTFDALASMIGGATTLDALAEIRNLVPSVESSDDRDELLGMLEVRAAELTPGAA